jgi:ABC-type dipeptide/oligopeptide/nickel transport system permease component
MLEPTGDSYGRELMTKYVLKRLAFLPPQIIGVTLITFLLVRLLPGNPAVLLLGPDATPLGVARMDQRLGLSHPLYVQYALYLNNLIHGNLGTSFYTGQPVTSEIGQRLPATLELITYSLIVMVVLGLLGGAFVAWRPKGIVDRVAFVYGMLAGALPDFWLGLLLLYFFFFKLGWLPPPVGRIASNIPPPPHVTGFYTIDSVLSRDWPALASSVEHLILPVTTLVLAYMGSILKMTRASLSEVLQSDMIEFARASGLSRIDILRYGLRNAFPPIVTVIGLSYGFLLGGAVLVETIFSWGGLGQYAVQAVLNSDYAALQGFLLVAAIFNLFVYLAVDIVNRIVDPRRQI